MRKCPAVVLPQPVVGHINTALLCMLPELHVMQTKAWMVKHRHKVAQQMRAEKEKQVEPLHRRTAVRQRAAQQEIMQASNTSSLGSALYT